MKDSEIRTDTYTETHARLAWNEALRRFGCPAPQPYGILGYVYSNDPDRPGATAVSVLETALEIAFAMGVERERERWTEGAQRVGKLPVGKLPMSLAIVHERERELLRTAVGLLADIQKMDGQIANVLDSYSSKVVGELAAVSTPDPPRCIARIDLYGSGAELARCNRARGRHTIVGGIHDQMILHVAQFGPNGAEISWRGPAGEE